MDALFNALGYRRAEPDLALVTFSAVFRVVACVFDEETEALYRAGLARRGGGS